MNPTAISQNKEWRQKLDNILQSIKFDTNPSCSYEWARNSKERETAIMKLQEAIMWIGMDLKAINEECPSPDTASPYPNSYNPESPVIDKTADGLKL